MAFQYYLIDVPDEGVQVFVKRSQAHEHGGPEFDYLMDYADLCAICQDKGWTIPTSGSWCQFPEPLEMALMSPLTSDMEMVVI